VKPTVIEVKGLTKAYGRTVAVDDLSFEVTAGTVTGFLGPNGAGKTTTMRSILGLIRPDAGETRVLGVPYQELHDAVRRVGALVEGQGFHPGRTARAHLLSLTSMAGIAAPRVEEVLDLVDLTEAADRRVGTFSLGMRQRLGLAGAMIGDPDILVLDEPANGLDPAGIRWMRTFLRSYAEEGRTVFVSSHVLSEMAHFVDEVVVMRQGRLVTHTPIATLIHGDQVLVKTPEPERLARALERGGATVEALMDGHLRVGGRNPDEVGDVARAEGIPLHELTRTTQTLEDVFLQLTEGEQLNA
jgi:ABC-2 type transport system ATP-binding protein